MNLRQGFCKVGSVKLESFVELDNPTYTLFMLFSPVKAPVTKSMISDIDCVVRPSATREAAN